MEEMLEDTVGEGEEPFATVADREPAAQALLGVSFLSSKEKVKWAAWGVIVARMTDFMLVRISCPMTESARRQHD
jgi:hypothetical protein